MPENTYNSIGFWRTVAACILGAALGTSYNTCVQGRTERKIDQLLNRPGIELQVKNVIGTKLPEKFYEINGKKFYLEVDGKPVENYFES